VDHALHFGVANFTPFQVCSPSSSNDHMRRIEGNLHTLAQTQNEAEEVIIIFKRVKDLNLQQVVKPLC
jgi:hypothetical protein